MSHSTDSPSAEEVCERHDVVDDLAEREGAVGAVFRALKTAAGEEDDE